ncbi:MAG TPA: Gfo/Idh/MocA family oxidoreductase [Nitrososphaerales archaeon]|nr:Gfo/Idh/MocA family oxidoreductase [Nitrososphaerales archaeon]
MPMVRLRFGIVGYGRFGAIHASNIAKVPDLELSSICVNGEGSLLSAKKDHPQATVFQDYGKFIQEGEVDALIVATPNYLHASQAIKAISAGKHVLVEKPMGISTEEALRVHDFQKQNPDVKVQIGFELRYSPYWQYVKQLADDEIGRPTAAKIDIRRSPSALRPGSKNWRYEKSKVGHLFFEELIHYVDAANWLIGSTPTKAWCTIDGGDSTSLSEPFRSAFLFVEYRSGTKFLIASTIAGSGFDLSLSVVGDRGSLRGEVTSNAFDQSYIKMHNLNGSVSREKIVPYRAEPTDLEREIADFANCVRRKVSPRVNTTDGFNAVSVCLAAARSARSKREESVEQFLPT